MADNTNPPPGGTIDLRNPKLAAPGTAGTTSATGSAGGKATSGQSLFDRFDIPDAVRQQYSDLIPLILQTESMNDDERQYWFQILPIMTEEQVKKLRDILMNEKNQLAQLDKDYEKELKRINEKHVGEWKAFEAKEKRQKLQAKEVATQKQEQSTEEDLLKKLQGL